MIRNFSGRGLKFLLSTKDEADPASFLECPNEGQAVVGQNNILVGSVRGVPLYAPKFGTTTGLPKREDGVFVLVPAMVVEANSDRNDLIAPNYKDDQKIIEDRSLVGSRSFIRIMSTQPEAVTDPTDDEPVPSSTQPPSFNELPERIVNLTNQLMRICNDSSDEPVITLEENKGQAGPVPEIDQKAQWSSEPLCGIPVHEVVFGETLHLPPAEPGVLFVVSKMVAERNRDRSDLICPNTDPNTVIRDKDTRAIYATRGFCTYARVFDPIVEERLAAEKAGK